MAAVTFTIDNPFGAISGQEPVQREAPGVKLSENLWVDPFTREVQTRPQWMCTRIGYSGGSSAAPFDTFFTPEFVPNASSPTPSTFTLNRTYELSAYLQKGDKTSSGLTDVSFNWANPLSVGAKFAMYDNINQLPAGTQDCRNPQPKYHQIVDTRYVFLPKRNILSGAGGDPYLLAWNTPASIFSTGGNGIAYGPISPPAYLPNGAAPPYLAESAVGLAVQAGRGYILTDLGNVYSSNVGVSDWSVGGAILNLRSSGVSNLGNSFTAITALGTKYVIISGIQSTSVWEVGANSLSLINVTAGGVAFPQSVVAVRGTAFLLNSNGISLYSEDIFKSQFTSSQLAGNVSSIASKFYEEALADYSSIVLRDTPQYQAGGSEFIAGRPGDAPISERFLQGCYSEAYNAILYFNPWRKRMLYVYLGESSPPFASIWSLSFSDNFRFRGLFPVGLQKAAKGSFPILSAVTPSLGAGHYLLFLDTPDFRNMIRVDQALKFPLGSGEPNFYNEAPFTSTFDTGPLVPTTNGSIYSGLEVKEMVLGLIWDHRSGYGTGQPSITAGLLQDRGILSPDSVNTLPQQNANTTDILEARAAVPDIMYYSYRPDPKPVRVPWVSGRTDRPRVIVKVDNAGPYRVSFGSLSLVAQYTKKRKDTNE